MKKRFLTTWFPYLKTDWYSRRQPELHRVPFVLTQPVHGRMFISAANTRAERIGIYPGMVLADARTIYPSLKASDDIPGLPGKLLKSFAEYCIRFTPLVATDQPDGLILDITGCAHLWGGEDFYIADIIKRFKNYGYEVKAAIADTIGAAWAVTRFGDQLIVEPNKQDQALFPLPPPALRLEQESVERLFKLGFRQVKSFIAMPRSALRRRFGNHLLIKLDQALGNEEELIQAVNPDQQYVERLHCLELISTATGIEIALERSLEKLCSGLEQQGKGLRLASFTCYRIDGKAVKLEIATGRPTHNINHLFKLFQPKLPGIEPGAGIELFTIEAKNVEDVQSTQQKIWMTHSGLDDTRFAELIDRIANRVGADKIHRYLPDEHYWPERSVKATSYLHEKLTSAWRTDNPRPIKILAEPELIQVTAPIPDYPPMLFRYKNKLHKVIKADGPERIEREWWLEEGQHRDYYCVEDEEGSRYWLFRSGYYSVVNNYRWFIHGFFA